MARPTSWLGTSAAPRGADGLLDLLGEQLRAASSSTGRPWQARRTPAMTLARLNGSVTPLRLTTASDRLLDGGEPPAALRAGPAAAGGRAVVGLPRVDDPAVGVVAERAAHRGSPPPRSGPPGCPVACRPAVRTVLWTLLGTSGGCPGENLRTACGRAYNSVTTRCRGTLGRVTQDVQAIRDVGVFRPDTAVTRENIAPQQSHDTPRRRAERPPARRRRTTRAPAKRRRGHDGDLGRPATPTVGTATSGRPAGAAAARRDGPVRR